MLSLAHALKATAEQYGAQPAVIGIDRVVDYASFDVSSDAIATSLVRNGIAKGDRVALYCINCAEFAIAYAGIIKAGAAVVPLNLLQPPDALAYILQDSDAKGLLFHAAFAEQAGHLLSKLAGLSFSISIGARIEGSLAWEEEVSTPVAPPVLKFDANEDLAAILYTSGTTGKPKGAMLTHANLLANVDSVHKAMQWRRAGDVVIVVLPMFHAFAATVGMLAPLLCGSAIVPLPKFDPEGVATAIARTQASIFLGVPSMFSVLLRLKPEQAGLFQSLRFCVSGGASLPVEILRRFEAQFGKTIYEGDGPTECSPVTCVNPIDGLVKPGTVGLPVPNVEMRIVDDEGRELPRGEVGEIAVRGPNVMKGYWKLPEATRETFRDGWFLTGDLGTEDEDGYFSIVDRKKDLIIVNGMNVYPRIVEESLYRMPGIREVAVVGELHGLHGEIPVAFIVREEEGQPTEADIRNWCKEHLGRHEFPRKYVFIPELPKNAAGKVLKRELRKHGEVERGVVGLE
ncbi:long-chain fatty acid--CoA ligase [Methylococcus sp. EFPC2]|uniref:long-chain-fatty-acid--CoA ligase n=1 Tax=Methylococcus sp. EFPC2 TaxID=2812648 RepID=UPI001966CFAF|nr:long-chain fatty acid--CoA ligase [Methylococcus sp. EFPC2]QSA98532.1 long-chain fatty acid--CoA ligase [Methylococcus sp. EFPC2]